MFASELLVPEHDLTAFSCGKPPLDRWLKESALNQAARNYSKTWVWTSGEAVHAYFTLLAHAIAKEDVSNKVGGGGPASIPVILLAKLALDEPLHGQGLGSGLLIDALSRCVAATDAGPGARLVVVDALDAEAQKFYEHYGFKPVAPGSDRLYRRMSDVATDLYGD